tara:strand:- start:3788 stop:5290 length:1503 start_codon:yes stop_codon:yes gene_type:complete
MNNPSLTGSKPFPTLSGHNMKRHLWLAAILLLQGTFAGADETEKAVVQILTAGQQPNWSTPWQFGSVRRSSGTGFVIKGRKIMTNAHVVSWARQILVKRPQDSRLYVAHVKYIGHDCDLALLEVEDSLFFEGIKPLEFGKLPKVRTTVVTYGYPAGGEQISFTRGVVSRIEMQTYAHIGNRSLLGVQTDAAINPGNSGGPVIQDGKVIGVAFQGIPGLENAGFFIPPPVIEHFLEDIDDKTYDGFPQAGIRFESLQNPAYRKKLKLPDNGLGARVDSLVEGMPAAKVLELDDVVLKVGDYPVGSDGTIIYGGNRLQLPMAIQEAQSGGQVPVTIWRNGEKIEALLPVESNKRDRRTGNQYDLPPRYYVYGGVVFTPLSFDYMRAIPSSSSTRNALVYELFYRRNEKPKTMRDEAIVVSRILQDRVNANLRIVSGSLVDKINGKKINKLEDVIAAFEKAEGQHHLIEFQKEGAFEVLDREEADKANKNIARMYGIPSDRRL